MRNPHRAKLYILENCDWIDEITHHPNEFSPCNRWQAFNTSRGEKIRVRCWDDGGIVTFAKKLIKKKD